MASISLDEARQLASLEAKHMQDRAEHLALQLADGADFEKRRRDEGAGRAFGGKRRLKQVCAFGASRCRTLSARLRLRIDHRPDIGFELRRIANAQLRHRALEHANDAIRDVVLKAENAKRRAALARGVEGGGQHIANHLLRQRGGVDDHGVLAAGLRDEGNIAALRERCAGCGAQPRLSP